MKNRQVNFLLIDTSIHHEMSAEKRAKPRPALQPHVSSATHSSGGNSPATPPVYMTHSIALCVILSKGEIIMKKSLIVLLFILLSVATVFAESSFRFSLSDSLVTYTVEPSGPFLTTDLLWPYSMDVISLTYLHDITEGSRFQVGGDIGGGTWGTFAALDAAYTMPVFTAGNFNFELNAIEKIGVYFPYFSLISVTDLELTTYRPGKKFFMGAGLSTSVNALWGTFEADSTESSYRIVVRPDIKFTCGWRFN